MQNQSAKQEQIRVHVFVSGKVQGVGYRYYTSRQAKHLGVSGWVRNLLDGRVEGVFEGEQDAVQAIVRWCHTGSRGAVVKEVVVEYEEPEGLQRFEIMR
ncbi:MAG TPA: acylphosphatase [Cyanobacteria bacterium UBA8803]|nr:acylphosphatase [Cyanobacteria bacterium UBA9273]HBL61384.1 acylphosphatase [Cyanobacteria bacterium UBA8803]